MHYVKDNNNRYKKFYSLGAALLLVLVTISLIGVYREEPKFADVNQDGAVDISDMALMRAHQLGNRQMTKKQQRIADVNRDGEINEADFEIIREVILANYGEQYTPGN